MNNEDNSVAMDEKEQKKDVEVSREHILLLDKDSPQAATELDGQCDSSIKKLGFLQRIFYKVVFIVRWFKLEEDLDTIVPKVDAFPLGYPRLAAWVDSDPNYVEYRRYGYLRHRCLLYMQDELAVLERELSELDAEDAVADPKKLKCRFRDNSKSPRRTELLLEIKSKMREYDKMLFKTRELMHWNQPTPRNRRSYANFINNSKLLLRDEDQFINYSEDLVALGGELDDSWFNGVVEDAMHAVSQCFSQLLFRTRAQRMRTDNKYIVYYSKPRVDLFIRLIMTVLCTFLLMSPVFVLNWIQQTGLTKDIVVLGFTLLFAICLAIFTKAKRHELFAATAGYCAVLVVFLSNSIISLSYGNSTSTSGALLNTTVANVDQSYSRLRAVLGMLRN